MQSPEDIIYLDRSYRSNDSEKSSEGKQKSNVSTSSSINDSNINNNPLISCVEVEIQNQDGGKDFLEVVEAYKSTEFLSGNSSNSFSSTNSLLFSQHFSPKNGKFEMDENINLK